jgi:benzoate membrane transport protein
LANPEALWSLPVSIPLSPILAAVTAAIVGCGGAIAVVFAACAAVRATPAETSSWIAGLCLAIALSSGILSIRYRLPILTAWSTPGAALIAASASPALTMQTAVGAFVVAAVLIVLSALIKPLGRLIERLPMPIAAAMLAGILLRLVIGPFESLPAAPWLILPLITLFLVLRVSAPSLAVIGVLIAGVGLAALLGQMKPLPPLALAEFVWIVPAFDPSVALGLGVPLYLVTMASQNLAGFAVLRASGYGELPTRPILAATGALSFATAFTGAHTSNLAAISAAICTGPECHADLAQRWWAGPPYMAMYLLFAIAAPSLVALFAVLPPELVKAVAGLALAAPMTAALVTAFSGDHEKFISGLTFAVTASGMSFAGVGSAFWGLVAGVVALLMNKLAVYWRN